MAWPKLLGLYIYTWVLNGALQVHVHVQLIILSIHELWYHGIENIRRCKMKAYYIVIIHFYYNHVINLPEWYPYYYTQYLLYTCRPSLPSNILELGDPDLVPQLMPILPEVVDQKRKELPRLSDKTLAEIWQKYVVNAPKIQWVQVYIIVLLFSYITS